MTNYRAYLKGIYKRKHTKTLKTISEGFKVVNQDHPESQYREVRETVIEIIEEILKGRGVL